MRNHSDELAIGFERLRADMLRWFRIQRYVLILTMLVVGGLVVAAIKLI